MFDQDMTRAEVASALGESMATMSRWFQVWCEQGSAALGGARRSGPPGKLTPGQLARVEDALLAGPQANGFPAHGWSVERVAGVIERVTGVRCSAVTTWVVLRERLGWVPLATWVKPAAPHNGGGSAAPPPGAPGHRGSCADGGAVTPDCPLDCLATLVSLRVYHRIREAQPDPHTVADVITLYHDQRLSQITNLGPVGIAEIKTALTAAGLLHAHAPHP
jgi:transposase